jgi:SAM-dependent methyltransferase
MDAPRYDLQLFERLNEEYRSKPLLPAAPQREPESRKRWARYQLGRIVADVDLDGKRVLELGCAHGQMTRLLVERANVREAVGVDVVESPMWERLSGKRVRFEKADLATEKAYPDRSFDVIVSNAVLEHVERPLEMLEAIARMLAVGGTAWLLFNLHRGPKASHRYREVFFPWPHLLFEPVVCADFYRERHGIEQTFAWVNRLTAAEYMEGVLAAGLHVVRHRRETTPIDIPFYLRFVDKLGSYPALDLETDFLFLLLDKRRRRPRRVPALGYLERQREFDGLLEGSRG